MLKENDYHIIETNWRTLQGLAKLLRKENKFKQNTNFNYGDQSKSEKVFYNMCLHTT